MQNEIDPVAGDAGDEALDPAAMLALLETQQRSVTNQFGSFVWIITGVWGVAWFFGFLAMWLVEGLKPVFSLPLPVASVILGVLLAIAITISVIFGVRNSRGVKESRRSAFTSAVYGCTWSLAMMGLSVLGMAMISQGMPADITALYFTSAYVLMTGVLFMVSAAIWHAVPALVVGIWLVIVAAVAPLFGTPNHYLFLAIAGGLAFIGLSIGARIYSSKLRKQPASMGGLKRG